MDWQICDVKKLRETDWVIIGGILFYAITWWSFPFPFASHNARPLPVKPNPFGSILFPLNSIQNYSTVTHPKRPSQPQSCPPFFSHLWLMIIWFVDRPIRFDLVSPSDWLPIRPIRVRFDFM
jgi:hypothetical protein